MNRKKIYHIFFIILLSFPAMASDAVLALINKNAQKRFKTSELLQRNDLETITIQKDPAYPNRTMTYKAIKVTHLMSEIQMDDDAVIEYRALDGFSAPLSQARLLNQSPDKSVAYIAIEPLNRKWPKLKSGKSTAGPFYLIWKNPELSSIGTEEWPFKLAAFEIKGSLKSLYPKIFPDHKISKNDSVSQGFDLFVKNCFACHTLNNQGSSNMGPDLNLPMNPTEYFQDTALIKLIRNPEQVRKWPKSQMVGFDADSISDDELVHIINFLKHMSERKQ